MFSYVWKVRLMKNLRFNLLWRWWETWRGRNVGNYAYLSNYIRQYAPGHSFADIGCMWGVNGEYSFIAEEAGATEIKAVDVFGPTPEFEGKKRERKSAVEFILGDVSNLDTITRIGVMDVVFCAGVLYHHPSPFDLLVALRRICRKTLILRTWTILEIRGLPNAAIYFPMLDATSRRLWDMSKLGTPKQLGITEAFQKDQGYGNFFWGLSPSCLISLLETAGFRINYQYKEPFAHTVICSPVDVPLVHRLPEESEARQMGVLVSKAGISRPA
jgi:hypothetical protein